MESTQAHRLTMAKYNEDELYVIVMEGYMSEPDMSEHIYTDEDEAHKLARERQKQFPDLRFTVCTLGDYHHDLRSYYVQ